MKKASVLIIASVLLAALLCLAGCGSSSSGEGYSSSGTGGAKDASHSKSVSVADADAGLASSLSGDWEDLSYVSSTLSSADFEFTGEEDKESGHDSDTFAYYSYDNGSYREYFQGVKTSGYEGKKITDYSKEAISEIYSEAISVDREKLDSGTYYVVKGASSDGELYYVIYDIIKNGYDIRYTYESYGGESDTPHLSDFEKMVNNVDYFDPAGHDKD